ncbi:MAG: peptide deformylase [Atopobiaceae bacterium]|nr:peptide deformylase [Atopobiaceae bacterium]
MIKPIMTQTFLLKRPSTAADAGDLEIARDLADTLEAHRATCAGMAANMIGQLKRIIAVVDDDGSILVMLNPEIVRASGSYTTSEGCLSLPGVRETTRFQRIAVRYDDTSMRSCERTFKGFVAQAVQHEIDHCNGVLI